MIDQFRTLRVSDKVIAEVSGRTFLDDRGRFLTVNLTIRGPELEGSIGIRWPGLRERVRVALGIVRG